MYSTPRQFNQAPGLIKKRVCRTGVTGAADTLILEGVFS